MLVAEASNNSLSPIVTVIGQGSSWRAPRTRAFFGDQVPLRQANRPIGRPHINFGRRAATVTHLTVCQEAFNASASVSPPLQSMDERMHCVSEHERGVTSVSPHAQWHSMPTLQASRRTREREREAYSNRTFCNIASGDHTHGAVKLWTCPAFGVKDTLQGRREVVDLVIQSP